MCQVQVQQKQGKESSLSFLLVCSVTSQDGYVHTIMLNDQYHLCRIIYCWFYGLADLHAVYAGF